MGKLKCIDCGKDVEASQEAVERHAFLEGLCKARGWLPVTLDLVCKLCAGPWRAKQADAYREEWQVMRDFEAGKINEWDIPPHVKSRNKAEIAGLLIANKLRRMGQDGRLG